MASFSKAQLQLTLHQYLCILCPVFLGRELSAVVVGQLLYATLTGSMCRMSGACTCKMASRCMAVLCTAQPLWSVMVLNWRWNTVQNKDLSNFGSFIMTVFFSVFPPSPHLVQALTAANCVSNSQHVASRCRVTTEFLLKILSLLFNHCYDTFQLSVYSVC
jgi:hypothetical protein